MKDKVAIVKKYIDEYDYYGLLDGGAPEDEFDLEVQEISDLITADSSVEQIAEVISLVMSKAFGKEESSEGYSGIAVKIKSEL